MITKNSSYQEVVDHYKSDINLGLSDKEAQNRLNHFGKNQLTEGKKTSFLIKFLSQFKDFLVIILLIAAIVSVIIKPEDYIESIIILLVVILNATIGVIQESKAEKSLDALKNMSTPNTTVIRDGKHQIISSQLIVPGDIIIIDSGSYIPADGVIIEAVDLHVDESSLTGESIPAEKNNRQLADDVYSLGDLTNRVFSSTFVTTGNGKFIVTDTGMDTEIGKIAQSITKVKNELTPLQQKLDQIGKTIGFVCIFVCFVVLVMEMLSGSSFVDAFMVAIALTVASVPEGLSAIVTVILAIGVGQMAKLNAIVKKLPAVETLGSASVICSDKTGTLTENKMTITKVYTSTLKNINENLSSDDFKVLEYLKLCSNATEETGDPTEIALVIAANKYVIDKKYHQLERVHEIPFDSDRKLMTVILKYNPGYLVITKGAPDEILRISNNSNKETLDNINIEMGNQALRVLAVAYKIIDKIDDNIESNLKCLGFVGLIDPERQGVKESIQIATAAGVRTVMITGDHIATAKAIATNLEILKPGQLAITGYELSKLSDEELKNNISKYAVFARINPSDKVRIVEAWQKNGCVVAMTGDGVNDSPALKKADIGCAMGITGTDVAKEAADVILTDDNFTTIVSAVKLGRGIYANIQKVVRYLLSSNMGEIITIFLASLISAMSAKLEFGTPLIAVHLLWINLITDTLPAFALGNEKISDEVMTEPIRRKSESFFSRGIGRNIIWQGIVIGIITLFSYIIGHKTSIETGQTMAFMTLASTQLFHAFNVKSEHSIFNKKIFNNIYLIIAFIIGMGLQLILCYVPFIANLFKVVPLPFEQLITAIGLGASIIVIVEIYKLARRAFKRS